MKIISTNAEKALTYREVQEKPFKPNTQKKWMQKF